MEILRLIYYNKAMNVLYDSTSNGEMITISRAEYEAMQAQLKAKSEELNCKNEELKAKSQELAEAVLKNEWLMEQLKLKQRKLFGSSSEQLDQILMEEFSHLFNEAECWDHASLEPSKKKAPAKRKRRSGSLDDIVPEGTAVEIVEHHLPESQRLCPVCGSVMVEIGKEVRRSLQMKPARFWIREDHYYTYVCKACEEETGEAVVTKVSAAPSVLPGSFGSASAVAHIAVQKYVMHSPLYRLEQEFGRQGLKLTRQTMSNWLLKSAEDWLTPIYNVLHQQLQLCKVLHGDETTLQVLREKGKSSTSKSYMWLYRTSGDATEPIVLYDYQPNRKAQNAKDFLDGFSGWLHADGYQGYHTLPEQIRVVGCWAHARRKFDEALTALPADQRNGSKPAEALCRLAELFEMEEKFSALTAEERHKQRLEHEKPALEALLAWANLLIPKVASKSALGGALSYLTSQWPYLIRILEDGRLEATNNRAERSIKPFVMGRKNWLFSNTPGGARGSAVIFSLIETAKETGLDPYRYLLWVLEEAPSRALEGEHWAESMVPAKAPSCCCANSEKEKIS